MARVIKYDEYEIDAARGEVVLYRDGDEVDSFDIDSMFQNEVDRMNEDPDCSVHYQMV